MRKDKGLAQITKKYFNAALSDLNIHYEDDHTVSLHI